MRIIVMGSTRGTSLDGILDSDLREHICMIVSDKLDAPILKKGRIHNIKTYAQVSISESRVDYDKKMVKVLKEEKPDVILMIGYMRIVSDHFVESFKGKMLNIHPSLLPKFGGLMDLKVHEAVLDANETESGCTIHQVTEQVDDGEIVLQLKCNIDVNETPLTLKEKIQKLERQAWIKIVKNMVNNKGEILCNH